MQRTHRISFEELKCSLVSSEIALSLDKAPTPPGGRRRRSSLKRSAARVAPSESPAFIAPDVLVSSEKTWKACDVLLVAAPAAVGKSVFARQLSHQINGLLWDLSEFELASGSFRGVLSALYGDSKTQTVLHEMHEGRMTFIVDAADEALVAAGAAAFAAGLDNLLDFLPLDSGGSPSIVIFGRPDTLRETASIIESLDEDGVIAVGWADIAFFTVDQAVEFVLEKAREWHAAETIDADSKTTSSSFEVARDELTGFVKQFFALVAQSIDPRGSTSDANFNSIVGYSPILEALGRFYWSENNPMAFLSRLQKDSSASALWDVLSQAMYQVLCRETKKFVKSTTGFDEDANDFQALDEAAQGRVIYARSLYSPENQVALLLALESEATVDMLPPVDGAGVDESWRDRKVPIGLRDQFRDHPFVDSRLRDMENPLLRFANIAFRDYVIYRSLVSELEDSYILVPDLWKASGIRVGGFLCGFVSGRESELGSIPRDFVGVLMDSHSAMFDSEVTVWITDVPTTDDGDTDVLSIRFLGDGFRDDPLSVPWGGAMEITFSRSLTHAIVQCEGMTVEVGAGQERFHLGPCVTIDAQVVECNARELRVNGQDEGGSALRCESLGGAVQHISDEKHGSLVFSGATATYPWSRLARAIEREEHRGNLDDLSMEIRRYVRWFVKSSLVSGGLNYPADTMDVIINKGRASEVVHRFLLGRGYLTRQGEAYRLDLGRVNILTVLRSDLSDVEFRRLVEECANWLYFSEE